MAAMFKQMDPSPRVQRVKGFTSETANVLHGTLNRIFYLIELMPNKISCTVYHESSPETEQRAKPGLWRQFSGGNYLFFHGKGSQ